MSGTVDRARPIYSFLPWVRYGIAGELAARPASAQRADGRLGLTLRLLVNGNTARAVQAPVQLYGPGDITGLDPREIVRTEPPHLTADADPGYFPLVEFDRPDFPWLFTPAAPAGDVLAPWLCLVVVEKGAATRLDQAAPLPVLTCRRADLPDLATSSQWAHAQVAWTPPAPRPGQPGPDAQSVAGVLAEMPEQAVSRLVSVQPLAPNRAYYACVVPAFDAGRKAGLGEPVTAADAQALRPAWTSSGKPGDTVRLPVYFHWEFSTGVESTFESLARRLRRLPGGEAQGARVGSMALDVGNAGWRDWEVAPLPAADTVITYEGALRAGGAPPAPDAPAAVRERLERILAMVSTPSRRVLLPPLYGGLQAERDRPTADRPWLGELNLNPACRVAAGLGALVVRHQQEQLMAAAWEQAADRQRELQERAREELAAQVNGAFVERLARFTPEQLTQVTRPVHAQVQTPAGSVARQVDESTLPAAALSTSFRALVRPQGPLARRLAVHTARDGGALVEKLTTRTAPPQAAAGGTKMFSAPEVRAAVLKQLRPDVPRASEAPAEAAALPSFPQPMYELLRDYVPELFLPGLDRIAPNTVALLETNPRFVEAFLAGANHELGRELVWREFPTDVRGTFFRQFWDPPAPGAEPDVRPMGEWKGHLGTHGSRDAAGGQIVLLIRGDIVRRFPAATVYAVKAVRGGDGRPAVPATGEQIQHPKFRGTNAPDILFLGFALTAREAMGADGGPGYFIVIQEQPTEPRFGWSAAGAPAAVANAAALAHATLRPSFRIAIHAAALLPPVPTKS